MQIDLFNSESLYNKPRPSNPNSLLLDLFAAYYEARKNKRNTLNALAFELNYESNLFDLYEEIVERRYTIKPGICFISFKPVQREIFAADFRDRIVHHLVFNYINPVFEPLFIYDSYSCRKGKGTMMGIRRVEKFIRSCSNNYKNDCFILKMDIKGYFMSMNRTLLFNKIQETLQRHCREKTEWREYHDLVVYFLKKIIFNDPTKNCIFKGIKSDWDGLPPTKSLFHSSPNCGFPIGNLTSQLFSNIYLNEFDHFIKRELKIRYYGRYVDDFVLIHHDKEYLKSLIPLLSDFLLSTFKLTCIRRKYIYNIFQKELSFSARLLNPIVVT